MIDHLTQDEPEAIAPVAEDLRRALDALVDGLRGVERRPTAIARALGVNRVTVSRLLNALDCDDPLEVLQKLPGPESLRIIAEAAGALGDTSGEVVDRATACIDRFAALIRERFGTRGALHAAISDDSEALCKRYEEAARYDVYNGMRHVLGVEGDTWITSMIFSPNPQDDDFLAVTTLHGVVGMRRLRPDTPVRFTFGPPYVPPGLCPDPRRSPVALQELYTNEPATLETEVIGNMLVHRLAPGDLGKDALVDMLAVSHDPRGSRRYASPERKLGGAAIFHDVPVKVLHCDAIVHERIFPGSAPRMLAYHPGARGPANPNDPNRDVDRIAVRDTIEALGLGLDDAAVPGVPNYTAMIARVFDEIGHDPSAYRVHRVRIAYPVQGFQYVLAFEAPPRP